MRLQSVSVLDHEYEYVCIIHVIKLLWWWSLFGAWVYLTSCRTCKCFRSWIWICLYH